MSKGKKYLYEFVPRVCQGDDATFKGKMVLRVPSAPERFYFQDEMKLNVDDAIFAEDEESKQKATDKVVKAQKKAFMRTIGKAIELAQDFVEEVDIEHLSSGTKYTSFDDMSHDPTFAVILTEMGGLFMRGFAPSKNS